MAGRICGICASGSTMKRAAELIAEGLSDQKIADTLGFPGNAGRMLVSRHRRFHVLAPGSAVELPGRFLDPFDLESTIAEFTPIGDTLFLLEAAQQHHPTTYQRLLDAALIGAATAKLKRVAAKVRATAA